MTDGDTVFISISLETVGGIVRRRFSRTCCITLHCPITFSVCLPSAEDNFVQAYSQGVSDAAIILTKKRESQKMRATFGEIGLNCSISGSAVVACQLWSTPQPASNWCRTEPRGSISSATASILCSPLLAAIPSIHGFFLLQKQQSMARTPPSPKSSNIFPSPPPLHCLGIHHLTISLSHPLY